MRKGFSILFAILMVFSAAHVTIATHYCGGAIAATKISLSGELATCGMEGDGAECSATGNHLKSHCCDNNLLTIGIVNNSTPPVSITEENIQSQVHITYLPVDQSLYLTYFTKPSLTAFNPPGEFPASAVNLNAICSFRI
jgi:hypothetical protein